MQIHVEHVIGVLKQKYTILQGTLPISVIADKDDQEATIDKLIRVCCATSVHLLYHKIDVSLNIVMCIIYVLYNKVNICTTRIQFHKTHFAFCLPLLLQLKFSSLQHDGQYHLPFGAQRILKQSK